MAKSWRVIDYNSVLGDEAYLSRWFRKMLGLKFTYASENRSFNLRLSTIINLSGISPYKNIRDNLAYVKRILNAMDIISKIAVKPH